MINKEDSKAILEIASFIIGVLYVGFSLFSLYFVILARNYPDVPTFMIPLLTSLSFSSISIFFGYTAPIGIAIIMYPLNPKFRGIPIAISSCIVLIMSFFMSYSNAIYTPTIVIIFIDIPVISAIILGFLPLYKDHKGFKMIAFLTYNFAFILFITFLGIIV